MASEVELLFTAKDQTQKTISGVNKSLAATESAASGLTLRFAELAAFLTGPAGIGALIASAFALFSGGALISGIRGAVRELDEIAKTSDRIGVGVEAFQELSFAAQQSGVNINVLALGIQRFGRRVGEVSQGTGELRAGLEILQRRGLGIEIFEENGKTLRSVDAILTDFLESLAQIEDVQIRNAVAMKGFDSEGVAMVNIVREGAEGLRRLREEARELGVVFSAEVIREAEITNSRFDAMANVTSANLKRALLELKDPLLSAAELLARVAQRAGDFIDVFKDAEDLPTIDIEFEIVGDVQAEIDDLQERMDALNAASFGGIFQDIGGIAGGEIAALRLEIEELQAIADEGLTFTVRVPDLSARLREVQREIVRLQAFQTEVPGPLLDAQQAAINDLRAQADEIIAAIRRVRAANVDLFNQAEIEAAAGGFRQVGQAAGGAAVLSEKLAEAVAQANRQIRLLAEDAPEARAKLQETFKFADAVEDALAEIEALDNAMKVELVEAANTSAEAFDEAFERINRAVKQGEVAANVARIRAEADAFAASQGAGLVGATGVTGQSIELGIETAAAEAILEDFRRQEEAEFQSLSEGATASILDPVTALRAALAAQNRSLGRAAEEARQRAEAQIDAFQRNAEARTLKIRLELDTPTQQEIQQALGNLGGGGTDAAVDAQAATDIIDARLRLNSELDRIANDKLIADDSRRDAEASAIEAFEARRLQIIRESQERVADLQAQVATAALPEIARGRQEQIRALEAEFEGARAAAEQGLISQAVVEETFNERKKQINEEAARELIELQRRVSNERLSEQERSVAEELQALDDQLRKRLDLVEQGLLDEQEVWDAFNQQRREVIEQSDPLLQLFEVDFAQTGVDALKQFGDTAADSFTQFLTGAKSGKEVVKDFVASIAAMTTRMAAQLLVAKTFKTIIESIQAPEDVDSPEERRETTARLEREVDEARKQTVALEERVAARQEEIAAAEQANLEKRAGLIEREAQAAVTRVEVEDAEVELTPVIAEEVPEQAADLVLTPVVGEIPDQAAQVILDPVVGELPPLDVATLEIAQIEDQEATVRLEPIVLPIPRQEATLFLNPVIDRDSLLRQIADLTVIEVREIRAAEAEIETPEATILLDPVVRPLPESPEADILLSPTLGDTTGLETELEELVAARLPVEIAVPGAGGEGQAATVEQAAMDIDDAADKQVGASRTYQDASGVFLQTVSRLGTQIGGFEGSVIRLLAGLAEQGIAARVQQQAASATAIAAEQNVQAGADMLLASEGFQRAADQNVQASREQGTNIQQLSGLQGGGVGPPTPPIQQVAVAGVAVDSIASDTILLAATSLQTTALEFQLSVAQFQNAILEFELAQQQDAGGGGFGGAGLGGGIPDAGGGAGGISAGTAILQIQQAEVTAGSVGQIVLSFADFPALQTVQQMILQAATIGQIQRVQQEQVSNQQVFEVGQIQQMMASVATQSNIGVIQGMRMGIQTITDSTVTVLEQNADLVISSSIVGGGGGGGGSKGEERERGLVQYLDLAGLASLQQGGITTQEGLVNVHPREAIIPLDKGLIGNVSIEQNITFEGGRVASDTSVTAGEDDERIDAFSARLEEQMRTLIQDEQRPGGLLEGTEGGSA